MVQFVAGAAVAAAVIAAANSTKFKRTANKARRKIASGIESARDYIAAIDECARERSAQRAKEGEQQRTEQHAKEPQAGEAQQ